MPSPPAQIDSSADVPAADAYALCEPIHTALRSILPEATLGPRNVAPTSPDLTLAQNDENASAPRTPRTAPPQAHG